MLLAISLVVSTLFIWAISGTSIGSIASPSVNYSGGLDAQSTVSEPIISYVPGSTVKLEQLIGDLDKERHQPTLSQTVTRYGIQGTDLGYSFEHDGHAYSLFGDTLGSLDRALDTIATTNSTDPENGVRLDFLTTGRHYMTVQPPGISMGAFEVPVSGISLGAQMYVIVTTNHSPDRSTDKSVLTRFTPPSTFQPLRTISQLPEGRFIKMSMHLDPGSNRRLTFRRSFCIYLGDRSVPTERRLSGNCSRGKLRDWSGNPLLRRSGPVGCTNLVQ